MEQAPTNPARLSLRAGGTRLHALSLHGTEALSEAFRFDVELLLPAGFDPVMALGRAAELSWRGEDGAVREVAGMITAVETLSPHESGRTRAEVVVEPRLVLLKRSRNGRVLRNLSVPEIARHLLTAHGYTAAQVDLRPSGHYPARPYTLQAQESDWDFFHRLLAGAGIFYRFEVRDGVETIVLADHNAACPYLDRGRIFYVPESGQSRTAGPAAVAAFNRLAVLAEARWDEPGVNLAPDPLPEEPRMAAPEQANAHHGRPPAIGQAEGERRRQLLAEARDLRRLRVQAAGNVADLAPGRALSLGAEDFDSAYTGDYIVRSLRHEIRQPDDMEGRAAHAYACEADLIRRDTPYRPNAAPRPELPLLFPARIEAAGRYAQVDGMGRYRLRADFETEPHSYTEATPPVQHLTPYGGTPAEGQPVGWHLPLQDATEVLVTCLNNDPDRPLIVGYAPSSRQTGPVLAANRAENRLLTPAANELLMDDTRDAERILLQTFEGQTLIEFDAKSDNHLVRLACQMGGLRLEAGRNQHIESKQDLTERMGGTRTHVIEQSHKTQTKNKEIHHHVYGTAKLRAANNLKTQSKQDTQLTSKQRMRINAQRDVTVTVKGSDGMSAVIKNGSIFVQSATDVTLKGQGGGTITFENNGGGFSVDGSGNVKLFGKRITMKATQGDVKLDGPVDYTVPEQPQAPSPSALQAQKPEAVAALSSKDGTLAQHKPSWLKLAYRYTDGTGIKGFPYKVSTADGQAYKGKLAPDGTAELSDIAHGAVEIVYGLKEEYERQIAALRPKVKAALDHIIDDVRRQAMYQNQVLAEEGLLDKAAIYTGAFFDGLYQDAKHVVSSPREFVQALGRIGEGYIRFELTAWGALLNGDWPSLRDQFLNIARTIGMGAHQAAETARIGVLILSDERMRDMLESFPMEFFDAHSSVEKVHMVGALAFQVLFLIAAAVATDGIGAVAAAFSEGAELFAESRYFQELVAVLKEVVEVLERLPLARKISGRAGKEIETVVDEGGELVDAAKARSLHNEEWPADGVHAEKFKTRRVIDMDHLSPHDEAAKEALTDQGWDEDKIKQILSSGEDFRIKTLDEGDKLFGFNTVGRPRDLPRSAYWLDEAGYQDVKAKFFKDGVWDREGVKDYLALPCFNRANSLDTVEVTKSTSVVEAKVGKATELIQYSDDSGYGTGLMGKLMSGGGDQITATPSALKLMPK